MNKKLIIVAAVALTTLLGGAIFALTSGDTTDTANQAEDAAPTTTQPTASPTTVTTPEPSSDSSTSNSSTPQSTEVEPTATTTPQPTVSTSTPTPQPTTAATPVPTPSVSFSNYIDYAPGIIESTPGIKVVYFHADWCPTCNALQSDILANGIRSDVTFIKADYDAETELKSKYDVSFQTFTVLVDDSGNKISSHYAGTDPRAAAVIQAFNL